MQFDKLAEVIIGGINEALYSPRTTAMWSKVTMSKPMFRVEVVNVGSGDKLYIRLSDMLTETTVLRELT